MFVVAFKYRGTVGRQCLSQPRDSRERLGSTIWSPAQLFTLESAHCQACREGFGAVGTVPSTQGVVRLGGLNCFHHSDLNAEVKFSFI